jgi:hypothetical protein
MEVEVEVVEHLRQPVVLRHPAVHVAFPEEAQRPLGIDDVAGVPIRRRRPVNDSAAHPEVEQESASDDRAFQDVALERRRAGFAGSSTSTRFELHGSLYAPERTRV